MGASRCKVKAFRGCATFPTVLCRLFWINRCSLASSWYLASRHGERTLQLKEQEGIFAGPSSGAVLDVALRVAADMEKGKIVIILADGGWKYMSEQHLDDREAGGGRCRYLLTRCLDCSCSRTA